MLDAVGPQWGELNIGHLYQVLERLERDQLVSKRVVPQDDRPDRVVYRLTKAGRTELDTWLDAPFVRHAYRDDLFLKLFAAARLGRDRLQALLELQREAFLAEMAALGDLRRRHGEDPVVALLIEAASLHTKADLELVELAEASADALGAARSPPAGVETPPGEAAVNSG